MKYNPSKIPEAKELAKAVDSAVLAGLDRELTEEEMETALEMYRASLFYKKEYES